MSDSQTVSSNHIASLTSDMAKMDKACADAAKVNKDDPELKAAREILDKLRAPIANMDSGPHRTRQVRCAAEDRDRTDEGCARPSEEGRSGLVAR